MKDLQEYATVIDDFQHQIEAKIRNHHTEEGFPQFNDFQTTQQELDDYLFDHQAALDSEGTEKTRYTVAGILLVLPIIVISAFPDGSLPVSGVMSVLFAVGIGCVLFAFYRVILKMVVRNGVRKAGLNYPNARDYVEAVRKFNITK